MAPPVWSVGQVLAASDVNTWFVPLAGYKTSSTVRSTLALATDPDLQVTLAANAVYEVRAAIGYAAASGNLSFTWTAPPGIGGNYVGTFSVAGTTAADLYSWGGTQAAATSGGNQGILIEGMISTGGSGGTLGLQWASGSGPASLTVSTGSKLALRRIG